MFLRHALISLTAATGMAASAATVEEARIAQASGEYALAAEIAAQAGGAEAVVVRAESLNALAIEQAEANRWREALASLDEARELLPDNETLAANRDRAALNAAVAIAQGGSGFERALDLVLTAAASGEVAARRQQAGSMVEMLWARAMESHGEETRQREHLERSLRWQPDNVAALVDLAEWHQARADSDAAYPLLERAHALDPSIAEVGRMMRFIERDRRVTADHLEISDDHFTARFPATRRDFAETCLTVLDQERRRLLNALDHTPRRRIPVVVYTPEQFQDATLAPHWALASYDGQIRIVARSISTQEEREGLQDTLSHELTHAFVFDLAHANAPAWLNEGLAQNMETHFRVSPRAMADLRACARTGELIPIPDLPDDFAEIPSTRQAQIAYLSSACFVQMLLERHGGAALRAVLTDLRRGNTIEDAIRRNLNSTLEELDRSWRRRL